MAALNAYTLTISLIGINGKNVANILVQISLATPELVCPIGDPPETLFPAVQYSTTNENGIAVFNLLPSSLVGKYKVEIGGYEKKITMPESDVRFSEL